MTRRLAVRRTGVAHCLVAVLVVSGVLALLLLVGLAPVWSILAAVSVGMGLSYLGHAQADAIAIKSLRARPLKHGEFPQLGNLVEGLVVANGFRMPLLYVVEDAAPNAAAIGRNPRRSGLIFTTGLLDRLGRIELEGVLAHGLTRVRSGGTLLDITAGLWIGRLPPVLSHKLASRMLEKDSAHRADLAGVALTRYPPGLAAALKSLQCDGRVVKYNPRAYRHLWIKPPEEALIEPTFSLEARIDVLAEL